MDRPAVKYEIEDYPDACDFLARTVFETYWLPPIGFVIHRKERVRVKAVSVKREPAE